MKKRKTSYRSMAVRIIALALCMWLCFAGLLTWAVSEDMFRQAEALAARWTQLWDTNRGTEYADLPGAMEAGMISQLGSPYMMLRFDRLFPFVQSHTPAQLSSTDWLWGKWELMFGYDFSVVFYDENRDPIMTSGNRMTFAYTDTEGWQSSNSDPKGLGWVDLDAIDGAAETMKKYMGDHYLFANGGRVFLPVIRLTGWFEGNQFHPITLERGWYSGSSGTDLNVSNMKIFDQRGKVEWETLVTAPTDPAGKLTTIYGWDVNGIIGDYQKSVTLDGIKYESLTEMRLAKEEGQFVKRGLWESVICVTASHQDDYGRYCRSLTLRTYPVQYAMLRLIPAYLVSLLLTVLAVGLILRRLKRNLTAPLEGLSAAIANGAAIQPTGSWAEPYALEHYYVETRQALLDSRTEITRLNTALNYAKDAEEYRKRLISDITHELKTPLAVIHSYAEGLQAEIAPEKKEQYVQVILDEAERMDAMVLQMLDLSRLESGRVKLKVENFPLKALIQVVAEKFDPLLAEKNLTLALDIEGEVPMNGDEARMEQVITNFMSNAVKYSPTGGEIHIRAFSGMKDAYFTITNTANHLSEDGLKKVFDSFYREDASRTEKSTGLGLAIVKRILSLHSGECYVNNTTLNQRPAVEFGFTLPI